MKEVIQCMSSRRSKRRTRHEWTSKPRKQIRKTRVFFHTNGMSTKAVPLDLFLFEPKHPIRDEPFTKYRGYSPSFYTEISTQRYEGNKLCLSRLEDRWWKASFANEKHHLITVHNYNNNTFPITSLEIWLSLVKQNSQQCSIDYCPVLLRRYLDAAAPATPTTMDAPTIV